MKSSEVKRVRKPISRPRRCVYYVIIALGVFVILGNIASLLLMFVLSYFGGKALQKFTPHDGINLVDFVDLHRSDTSVYTAARESQGFFIVFRKAPHHLLYGAAGHPAYIFDENGKLIAWSIDIIGEPEFYNAWLSAPTTTLTVTHEEAKQLLQRKSVPQGNGKSPAN